MKFNHKFARSSAVIAGLAAMMAANSATAADVIYEEPPAPSYVESAPASDWSGAKAGVYGDYGFKGRAKDRTNDSSIKTKGFGGGVMGGYDWQQGNVVYGVQGDIGYSGVKGSNDGNRIKAGVEGSLRGRVGVAANDQILLYGTAGAAAQRNKLSNADGVDRKTSLGYTVGAGVDAKLTDQVFSRVEYRYSDYGKENYVTGGSGHKIDTRDHKVSVGLGVKF